MGNDGTHVDRWVTLGRDDIHRCDFVGAQVREDLLCIISYYVCMYWYKRRPLVILSKYIVIDLHRAIH